MIQDSKLNIEWIYKNDTTLNTTLFDILSFRNINIFSFHRSPFGFISLISPFSIISRLILACHDIINCEFVPHSQYYRSF